MLNQQDENWPLPAARAPALTSASSPAVAARPYEGIVHDEEYVSNFVFPSAVAADASAPASLRPPNDHGDDDDDDNDNEPDGLEPSPPSASVGTLPAPPTASSTGRYPTPVSHTISIRRGPQIRHLPVPFPPSPPARAAALAKAKDKVKAVFLALVLLTLAGGLSLAAAMTFVASQAAMQGQVSGAGVGWLVTSLVVSTAGAGILYLTRHQKPILLDDEWIELAALRGGRDLALPPPRPAAAPGTSLEMPELVAGSSSAAAPAFDPDIRIYIEDLEFQLRQLEDRLAAASGREPTGLPGPRPAALAEMPPPVPSKKGKEPADSAALFHSLTSRGSSRRLLAADALGQQHQAIPGSTTQGSILTQLCAAVTAPYSPLARDEAGESSKQPAASRHEAGEHQKMSSIDIACGHMENY